ncbi:Transposase-associated domain [Sesbania bispinosa]|nr:Transposase-associated domain [Sesbania bispinosa]
MMNKDWVTLPRFDEDYINGVNHFLDVSFTKGKFIGDEILCPCTLCCNVSWQKRDVVFNHLICKGFVQGYKDWIYHGEGINDMDVDDDTDVEVSSDDINDLLFETFKDVADVDGLHEGLNEDAKKFYNLVEEAKHELGIKHRPLNVPEPHFKKLCDSWSLETVQSISQRNTISRAKQKWRHRMGPRSFALIREKLRAKDNRDPSQAKVFIETRKGNKGKQLDEETDNVITQLQEMIENDDGNNDEAFQAVFGKEHPGAVRCYGRNVTQTSLKRNAEMNAMKKAHNEEVTSLNDKIDTMSDELGKLKHVKVLLQHGNFGVDLESLQGLLAASPGDASSAQRVAG